MSVSAPLQVSRGFSQVETWVFDLDNTLYPHHLNLWQQVDARIRDFIANFLKVGPEEDIERYLAPDAKRRLYGLLADALAPGGALVVGRTERIGNAAAVGLSQTAPHVYVKDRR